MTHDLDISRLTPDERILLAQELWDSVHEHAQTMPLTPEQREELSRRRAQLESGQVKGVPWEQFRKNLLSPE